MTKLKSCQTLIDYIADLLGVKKQEHAALYGFEILKAIKELKQQAIDSNEVALTDKQGDAGR